MCSGLERCSGIRVLSVLKELKGVRTWEKKSTVDGPLWHLYVDRASMVKSFCRVNVLCEGKVP